MRAYRTSLLALIFLGCGGTVELPSSSSGGQAGSGATGSASTSTSSGGSTTTMTGGGGADLDGGVDAPDDAPNLKPCTTTDDCPYAGSQECKEGYCCAGEMVGGECKCGDGPGCFFTDLCCPGYLTPDAVPTCHHLWDQCFDPLP